MDIRGNLFGKKPQTPQGGAGLPGRPVQQAAGGGYGGGATPTNYGSPGGRAPSQPQYSGSGAGGYGGAPSEKSYGGGGGGGYGGQPAPGGYPSQSAGRGVPLRLAKVDDKTLQSLYIFGNM